jgi:hypothetical protein
MKTLRLVAGIVLLIHLLLPMIALARSRPGLGDAGMVMFGTMIFGLAISAFGPQTAFSTKKQSLFFGAGLMIYGISPLISDILYPGRNGIAFALTLPVLVAGMIFVLSGIFRRS